ncbi:MAG: chemotaxis protein CheC [Proteobacteria bacterium]|nr:chemotaxis protein CheC [Pseudomonadota bacterium]
MPPTPEPEAIRAFLADVIEVLHETTGVTAVFDLGPGVPREEEITIMIHARGDLCGLSWTFPVALARAASRHMVPGLEFDRAICEVVASEIANIVTGRGATVLEQHGITIAIATPEVGDRFDDTENTRARLATIYGPIDVVFHELAPATVQRREPLVTLVAGIINR